MQSRASRYPNLLRARAPRELVDAVDAAARAKYSSHSEYVRQAVLRSLQADGAVPPQLTSLAA
jgi:Arc/MetJ-type ribon-helix-helix transcriptional regulator